MKKFWPVGLALTAALAIAPIAKADTYNISFTGNGLDATGTIEVSGGVVTSANLSFGNSVTGSLVTGLGAAGTPTYVNFGSYTQATGFPSASTYALASSEPTKPANSAVAEYASFDNKLKSSTTAPYFDGYGLEILLSNGDYLNIYGNGTTDYWNEYTSAGWLSWSSTIPSGSPANAPAATEGVYYTPLTASVAITPVEPTATPEPSSLMLLGTGLLSLAGLLFWKSKPSMVKEA